jgi:hypothetical protein
MVLVPVALLSGSHWPRPCDSPAMDDPEVGGQASGGLRLERWQGQGPGHRPLVGGRCISRQRLILVLADRVDLHVPVASSAASEVTWRSVRSDVVARVLWALPENIAADIRLVGPWRPLSGPCNGPLGTSTCTVTRQPSVQITWRRTSAALADILSQRTMPSACGGALPASSALRPEPASVPVSFRPPGCSPTTDLARFGSAVQRLSRAASRSVTGSAVLVRTAARGDISRFGHGRRSIAGLGRAITGLPALARFAPRPLVLDLADQVSTHLREGMIKVALVGGGYEVRPSR